MLEKIKLILSSEFAILRRNLKKEIKYIFSLSLKMYLKNWLFPKDMGYILVIIRIVTLFIIPRLIFDVLSFSFIIVFNFYFIFSERIFEVILRLNSLFFEGLFFFRFNFRIIRFFRYIFLFLFFVNISEDLKRKKIPLWIYILEFFADILIYIIRRQINWRYIFYPILKLIEIIVLILQFLSHIVAGFIDYILFPLYKVFRTIIFIRLYAWYRYFRIVLRYKRKGKYHINNMFLFHVSNNLQKAGFIAPVCRDIQLLMSAKLDYRRYRRSYIRSELTPDIVDKEALNIYIYLKNLLKDTRYQRRFISFFDVLVLILPYTIVVYLFFFILYFFMGVISILYILLFPFVGIYIGLRVIYIIYDRFYYVYCLCSKDLDLYVLRLKKNELRNERINLEVNKILNFLKVNINRVRKQIKNIFNLFLLKIRKVVIVVKEFIKQVYEKIFR